MTDGVVYLNTGMKHADNLVVSLLSLKDHWDGPVAIWHAATQDDQGKMITEACRDDPRLGDIRLVPFDFYGMPGRAGNNNNYLAKPFCAAYHPPFDRFVFLDADTVVHGDFTPLFPDPEELRVVQFEKWTANSGKMKGRIERWREVAPEKVVNAFAGDIPAINTGVYGASRSSGPFLKAWFELTKQRVEFMADELALQILYPFWPHVVMPCKFNCSPGHCWEIHGIPGTWNGKRLACAADFGLTPDPRIWHFHGQKAVKEPRARFYWLPYYERAVRDNVARIREWTPGAGNRRLASFLKDRNRHGPDFIPTCT